MGFDKDNLIKSYEHVGIRVSDRKTATEFYEKLGFIEAHDIPDANANEMVNKNGIYINLIFNGIASSRNVLQDIPVKNCGITHVAFITEDMESLISYLYENDIKITEGPVIYSNRRKVIFIRDPDKNVIEFNQIL